MHYSLLYFSFRISFSIRFWLINLHALQSSLCLLWCHIHNICSSRHVFYHVFPVIFCFILSHLFLSFIHCFSISALFALLFQKHAFTFFSLSPFQQYINFHDGEKTASYGSFWTAKSRFQGLWKFPYYQILFSFEEKNSFPWVRGRGSYSYLLSEIVFFWNQNIWYAWNRCLCFNLRCKQFSAVCPQSKLST